ncbi:hypothetical protein, partial [Rhodobacter capsulatus]|uniref:hypothetical protein n=1 Tax=Rhodobacter capsulatus TaxID=1061 RepID=UPI0019D6D282
MTVSARETEASARPGRRESARHGAGRALAGGLWALGGHRATGARDLGDGLGQDKPAFTPPPEA